MIRQINKDTTDTNSSHTHEQLQILKKRITYVKQMQTCGIVSFILCVFSIFSLFMNYELLGIYLFIWFEFSCAGWLFDVCLDWDPFVKQGFDDRALQQV